MKKFACLVLLMILLTCKRDDSASLPDLTKDEINAGRFWDRITEETNYKKYPMWPDHKGMQPGVSPHGRYHIVYINGKLRDAIPIADKSAPYGAMSIKENFNADKKLVAITAMVKIKDYNPEHGDWFWAEYDPDGKVLVEGKESMCINCHISFNNDYITIRKLDKKLK